MRQELWKTVENSAAFLRAITAEHETEAPRFADVVNAPRIAGFLACSGCAGDYEDPDITAWTEDFDETEDGDEAERDTATEQFPVQRN